MKNKKQWELPEYLKPELINLEKRLDEAIEWVEKNRKDIHSSISFIEAVHLYDFGFDVTQLKPESIKNGKR